MSGAIAGAYLGLEAIPKDLLRHCEDVDSILKLADDLYDATVNEKNVKVGRD